MDEMNIFETAPSFPVIPLRGLDVSGYGAAL